jgi:hypothetical protein
MAVFRGPEDESADGDPRERRRAAGATEEGARDHLLWWFLLQFLRRHRGKVAGVTIGIWVGFGVMQLGVLWTLFISSCVGIGYFIGRRLDDSQEGLLDFLDRVLPPGRR